MAMPGPYYEERDSIFFVTELAGWHNFPIKDALTKDFSVPIQIVNDANAGAFCAIVVSQQGIWYPQYDLCPGWSGSRLWYDYRRKAWFWATVAWLANLVITPYTSTVHAVNVATMAVWKSIVPSSFCVRTLKNAFVMGRHLVVTGRPEYCKNF